MVLADSCCAADGKLLFCFWQKWYVVLTSYVSGGISPLPVINHIELDGNSHEDGVTDYWPKKLWSLDLQNAGTQ